MKTKQRKRTMERTSVDDLRAVRERLSREADGNIEKLAEESKRFLEKYKDKLKLKVVKPPNPRHKSNGGHC